MTSLDAEFTWNRDDETFYRRHKLSNGQYCMIGFERVSNELHDVEEYNVVFAVADKKKQLNAFFDQTNKSNITLKSTGRCGIEALAWARDMILLFEKTFRNSWRFRSGRTFRIIVGGEDQRRFRIYEHYLSRYGFKKCPDPQFRWAMKKEIRKEDMNESLS